MEYIQPAKYSPQAISESLSINMLEGLLNKSCVVTFLSKNDKTPNYDGYLELIEDGLPIGKLEVQIKTLRKNYVLPSYSVKFNLLAYIRDVTQLPFVLIAVDNKNKKAYWTEISKELATKKLGQKKEGKQTISIRFPDNNEITQNPPYKDWNLIISEHKSYFDYDIDHVKETIDFEINKTIPIIDQLYQLFNQYLYAEINYVPVHLLPKYYPFQKSENSYYNFFTLMTDNEELFGLFDSLEIDDNSEIKFIDKKYTDGVADYVKKIKEILTKLTSNLVFNISSREKQRPVDIQFNNSLSCICAKCLFLRFEFSEAFIKLSINPKKVNEKFKLAYVNYQIGNFLNAKEILRKLANYSKKRKKDVHYFIAQYNLSKLSIFIQNRYWEENAQDKLVKKLKKINLDEIFCEYSNPENEKILNWIKNNSFYSETRDRIHKTVSKIIDNYYSQLKGGWSSNKHIWELINDYAEINAFINNNFIIYDGFNEFRELSGIFIEGIMVSHAIKDSQTSRLESFDDWIVNVFVFYGNADSIIKYSERYALKEINYKQSSPKGDSFIDRITRFLGGEVTTRTAFEKYCEKNNSYFWDRYMSIFSNLIVLAGLCNFDKRQINEISEKLLEFLKTEKSLHSYTIRFVRFFINRKGYLINKSTLKRFLLMTIENGKTHSQNLNEAILIQIKNHHSEITLSQNNYIKFNKLAYGKCSICKHEHSPVFMAYLYDVIYDDRKKDLIKHGIENSLKDNFNPELYFIAAMYGILEAKGDFFIKLIKSAKPLPNQGLGRGLFQGKDDNRDPALDRLLTLCYKYSIELKREEFNYFKGLDDYYDWLLDMKNFDYNFFNTKWIRDFVTIHMYKEIRKHSLIKNKIREHLKVNYDPQLEHVYIEIFCDIIRR